MNNTNSSKKWIVWMVIAIVIVGAVGYLSYSAGRSSSETMTAQASPNLKTANPLTWKGYVETFKDVSYTFQLPETFIPGESNSSNGEALFNTYGERYSGKSHPEVWIIIKPVNMVRQQANSRSTSDYTKRPVTLDNLVEEYSSLFDGVREQSRTGALLGNMPAIRTEEFLVQSYETSKDLLVEWKTHALKNDKLIVISMRTIFKGTDKITGSNSEENERNRSIYEQFIKSFTITN